MLTHIQVHADVGTGTWKREHKQELRFFFNGLLAKTLEAVYHHTTGKPNLSFRSRFALFVVTRQTARAPHLSFGSCVSYENWGVARLVKFWQNLAVRGCWIILKTGTERVFEVFHLRLSLSM